MNPVVRSPSLKRHLVDTVLKASEAPILVFNSKPTREVSSRVNDFVADLEGVLHHAVPKNRVVSASISSFFPTRQDVRDAQELVHLTGATAILGLGSGAAMDLVKALDTTSGGNTEQSISKILLPGTSTAVFAASTPFALILDLETQLLWTQENNSANHTSILQRDTIIPSPFSDAACRSILLDYCYRQPPTRAVDTAAAQVALSVDPIVEAPLTTAAHISTGLQPETLRSAPLALAASLVPQFFPRASLFSFWAALLPGLSQTLFDRSITRHHLPPLAKLLTDDNTVSVETMLHQVQMNQFVGGGIPDIAMEELEQILRVSLSD